MSDVNEEIDPIEKKFKKTARIILSAGMLPMPNNATFVEILKYYFIMPEDEEDLDFIANFKSRSSMSMEQLMKKSKLSEEEINRLASKLS